MELSPGDARGIWKMAAKRIFVLYKNSLFAQGIESLLREKPELEVVGIDLDREKAGWTHGVPDAVVVDMNDDQANWVGLLSQVLTKNPVVKVICVNSASPTVDIYRHSQLAASKVEDLVEAIRAS